MKTVSYAAGKIFDFFLLVRVKKTAILYVLVSIGLATK